MPEHTTQPGLQLQPLPADSMPPAVSALVMGASPAKLMATRGIAPLRPADLLLAVYQLSFDPDPAVRAAAAAAPGGFPDHIIGPPLAESALPVVLHFFAEHLPPERADIIEKILYNPAAADETFLMLAGRLHENTLEIILQNDVRLLRCPAIVEALFFNKQARMSSVSRAVELCARNGVRLNGIPGFDEMVSAVREDSGAAQESDQRFAAAMTAAENEATQAPEAAQGVGAASKDEAGDKAPTGLSFIKFDKLKIFEKIRLATVGNAYCRQVLVRDSNRLVAMAVVRSPQLTPMELVRIAGSTNVCDDVIRYISNNRECLKDYGVKLALVKNPKCPLGASLRLLTYLHQDDVKDLSRSKNVPGALAVAAKKLTQTREKR